jgi:hypothetical protein
MKRKWDWDSIFKTSAILGGIVLFVYFFDVMPGFMRKNREEQMDKKAHAGILEINKIRGQSHGNIYLNSIIVKYRFEVGDSSYFGADNIWYSSYRNKVWIDSLLHSKADSVWVKYIEDQPRKNMVSLGYGD